MQLDTVSEHNALSDAEGLARDLKKLKEVECDGVMVDCWWGLVEGKGPQQYEWAGYSHLFKLVEEAGLKLQVRLQGQGTEGRRSYHITTADWLYMMHTSHEGMQTSHCAWVFCHSVPSFLHHVQTRGRHDA